MRTLALVLVFSAGYAWAQGTPAGTPQEPRPPTIRTETNLVRVDVTVLDRRGEPLTDLKAEEFTIEEDGVPQPLEAFQLVRATGYPPPGDEQSLSIRSPEHAAAEAAREDVRVFLIFWDEYHLNPFVSSIVARQALRDFVLTAFGPRDLVALMDPLLPTDAIRFTRDRRALADAIHKLVGRRGVYVPPRSAMEEALLSRPRDIDRVRYEVTMTALKAAAVYLGTLREGRKTIIFASEGVWRANGTPLQREVIRAANEHNTAIYTMDPRGLGPRAADMLIDLANSTGGQAIVNTNAPARLLQQVVRHASAYYLLGYPAQNSPADGKFHRIRVRVARPGVEVRARSGYWAPTVGELTRARNAAASTVAGPQPAAARGAIAVGSPRRSIDLWIGSSRGTEGNTSVTLAWAPYTSGRESQIPAHGVELTATGADGRVYFQQRLERRDVTFDAPPGLLEMKLAVLDSGGVILERDVRRVSVPDFAGKNLAVSSPRLLRARSALELRTLLADPDAPPFTGREFRRTDRLLVRFEVYGHGAPRASVAARLMTRGGAALVRLPVVPIASRPGRYQVDLPLSATARGDFMIGIEANVGGEHVQSIVPLKIVG